MTTTSSGAGRYCGARALTGREGGEPDQRQLSEIRALCEELGCLLRARNNGVMPGR